MARVADGDTLDAVMVVYDFVTNIYTRPELGEHMLVGGLDAEESHDLADPDRYKEGVSLDESTDALARVGHRFPVLAEGRIARGYAGCFDVTPDWHPIMDQVGPDGSYVAVGFSGHGFKLSPAVGHMMAALVAEGALPPGYEKGGNRARLKLAARDIRSLEDHVDFLSNKITFLLDALEIESAAPVGLQLVPAGLLLEAHVCRAGLGDRLADARERLGQVHCRVEAVESLSTKTKRTPRT